MNNFSALTQAISGHQQASMPLGVSRTVEPAAEPLTTAQAKAQTRVENNVEDTQFAEWIKAAREKAEAISGLSLITQTLVLVLPAWPSEILLSRGPVQAVSSITYLDMAGVRQTLAADQYRLVNKMRPARVVPGVNLIWPFAFYTPGSIEVTYTAGYGASGTAVPSGIKQAMLLIIGEWYANREDQDKVPEAAENLLLSFREPSYYGAA